MSNQGIRNPKSQPKDRFVDRVKNLFYGMIKGAPATEIDGRKYAAKLVNLIAMGPYCDVRSGSKKYSNFNFKIAVGSIDLANNMLLRTTGAGKFPIFDGQEVWIRNADNTNTGRNDMKNSPYYAFQDPFSDGLRLALTRQDAYDGTSIDLSGTYGATIYVTLGDLNAKIFHAGKELCVLMFGNSVYTSNVKLESLDLVTCITYGESPSGPSTMSVFEDTVILASTTGIFRIDLSEAPYTMYKINASCPEIVVADAPEVAGSKEYGYYYIYSLSRIVGANTYADRISDGATLVWESGTSQAPGVERDYGERFYATPISKQTVFANAHIVYTMHAPDDAMHATHFSVYRTKNIGVASGGTSAAVDGVGNRKDYMVWVADIPIQKVWLGTGDGTATMTYVDGPGAPTANDVGSMVSFSLIDGSNRVNTTIKAVDTGLKTILLDHAVNTGAAMVCVTYAIMICADSYATQKLFYAKQTGYNVVISSTGSSSPKGVVTAEDVGKRITASDGSEAFITAYIDQYTFTVNKLAAKDSMAYTLPLDPNPARVFNDITPDSMDGNDGSCLQDRMFSGSNLYIPRRFFLPLPDMDCIVIDSGFVVAALRGSSKYYYSQIGDKRYHMGYYRPIVQEKETETDITQILIMPSLVVIFGSNKTMTINSGTSTDVGKEDVGENVFKMQPHINAGEVGVVAWKSIAQKKSNLIIAITSEPAVRYFDGYRWGDANLAIEPNTGLDAVQLTDISRTDVSQKMNSSYFITGGYKLWFKKWVKA